MGPTPVTAGELAGAPPGADLAFLLEVGADSDDDGALVEAVAAWERMAGWAAAGAARAAAALAERPSMNPEWPASAGKVSELNVAGEELALRLSCSRRRARTLVRDGRAFTGSLLPTGQALARGEISTAAARVLVEALDRAPGLLALDVQDEVLATAAGRTPAQVGRDVAKALIVMDPAGAHQRHRAAARGRRLDRPRFLPDGMAGLWAVLPAADAARLDAGIDDLARSARAGGDPRTLDQLRADVLVDLTTGDLAPCPGPTEVEQSRDGSAPAPEHEHAPAAGNDHAPAAESPRTPRAGGTSAPTPRARRSRRTSPRSHIRVTVPLATLIGTADDPGELAGYGPITAETARALARDGTWRRIVTDPLSGAVLDVGRTRYRPPEDLAEHVRARDASCVRPGCGARADACDLDHTVEYRREGGTTSADNLGPLCPRDHAIKTDGGFRLTQVSPGVFEWLTPAGYHYRWVPGGDSAVRRLPGGPGPRPGGGTSPPGSPPTDDPPTDDLPPF